MSRPVVLKIGGAILDDTPRMRSLLGAIAAHAGRGVVLVHGGGTTADRLLARLGIETPRIDGLRSTPDEAVDPVVGALAGVANHQIVSALRAQGGRAVGLTLSAGGMTVARRLDTRLGHVGEVVETNGNLLGVLLDQGFVPVVSSVGDDGAGDALNINADDAAVAVASACAADRLAFLTDVAGVLDAEGRTIERLDAERMAALEASGVIRGGMGPKVRGALRAAAALGIPVVIARWSAETVEALLGYEESVAGTSVVAASPALDATQEPSR
ncbi:MAG: acetylglutamate kinase [Planctomycetota bacterium]